MELQNIFMKLAYLSFALSLMCVVATTGRSSDLLETNVISSRGGENARIQVHAWPRTRVGAKPWTTWVRTLYLPRTGLGWAGLDVETEVAVVEDRIVSLYFESQRNRESLRLAVSTNRYSPDLTDPTIALQAEFQAYTNSKARSILGPPYHVYLEKLLGPLAVRDHEDPKIYNGVMVFAADTWPSKLKGVSVEGTNLVVTVEFGTNTIAKIAIDKNIRPVWATTNGVSIGPIPTNCTFYSDIISNKVTTRVVH